MTKQQYFHSTPNDVYMVLDAKRQEIEADAKTRAEIIQYQAWLNGVYVRSAVASVLSKKAKYPKNPIERKGDKIETDEIVATEDMPEAEKQRARELFIQNLFELQTEFEKTHKQAQTGDGE